MWICLNDGFLSVVDAPYAGDGMLAVRGRVRAHVEAAFPGAEILETPDRDYPFRTLQTREAVAATIAERVRTIEYTNFKDSVREPPLKHAYSTIWGTMLDYATRLGVRSLYAP
jgi:hypothetical protein